MYTHIKKQKRKNDGKASKVVLKSTRRTRITMHNSTFMILFVLLFYFYFTCTYITLSFYVTPYIIKKLLITIIKVRICMYMYKKIIVITIIIKTEFKEFM